VLKTTDNKIIFYYTKDVINVDYMVFYYLEGSTTSLVETKIGSGVLGSSVTENAITIPGYTAIEPASVSAVLKTTDNKIIFYYTANTNIVYTVHYYLENTTNSVAADKVVTGRTMNTTITENAIAIPGHTAINSTPITATLNATNNVLIFYYKTDPNPPPKPTTTTSTPPPKTTPSTETPSPTITPPNPTPSSDTADDNVPKPSTIWTFKNIVELVIIVAVILAVLNNCAALILRKLK
jgi:hypothetical protein